MVKKLANFYNALAKSETSSITISWSRIVFSPKPSLSLKNSLLDEKVSSSLLFLLAVVERALKTSNIFSNYSVNFG